MDIGDLRREFMSLGLDRDNLQSQPVEQFALWFQQAIDAGIMDPNAMSLATASASGVPSIRTVLLKFFDLDGFVFYTNYGSRKARQISENHRAALLFPWLTLNRQVKIEGSVEKVGSATSLKYFSSRPRGSQLGAWCSQQSTVITSRQFLEMKLAEMKEKYHNGTIPLPSFWGGYRVKPERIEFWQGRENRLHDRFEYSLQANGSWNISRLAP